MQSARSPDPQELVRGLSAWTVNRTFPDSWPLQVDVSSFALSVLVTQRQGLVETFVLGDTLACHTYDLRLARFHLLYEPWVQGLTAVSGLDRQSSSRDNVFEQRQLSRSASNARAGPPGAPARAASSQPGMDPSSGGDAHCPVRSQLDNQTLQAVLHYSRTAVFVHLVTACTCRPRL